MAQSADNLVPLRDEGAVIKLWGSIKHFCDIASCNDWPVQYAFVWRDSKGVALVVDHVSRRRLKEQVSTVKASHLEQCDKPVEGRQAKEESLWLVPVQQCCTTRRTTT